MNCTILRAVTLASTTCRHARVASILTAVSLLACAHGAEPEDIMQSVRQARTALRTNTAEALRICDRMLAAAPSNSLALYVRATVHDARREHAEALNDASRALQFTPGAADVWQLRGELNFKLGRFRQSVADFDKALEIVPAQRPHHWQRGISLYYAGEFAEGRKQFDLHQTVNPNDVENAVWHFLCVAGKDSLGKAREALLKTGQDARVPMTEVYRLFAGNGTADEVLAAVERGKPDPEARRARLFYAHLYLGLYFDAEKEITKAREHIFKAEELAPHHYMGEVARVHARSLRLRKP